MRKLKFTLNRKSLNQIYLSYILPILEYSAVVWDGCSVECSDSLQKIQNEAARIVTGLTRSVSVTNLFRECGWKPLHVRRETQKLCFMYRVAHNMTPSYINDLIPPMVGENNNYQLRNQANFRIPYCRTTNSQKSCIPSSLNLWNNLDMSTRNSDSLSSFKRALNRSSQHERVPQHYLLGSRRLSVLHACLRNNCSDLKCDLFKVEPHGER